MTMFNKPVVVSVSTFPPALWFAYLLNTTEFRVEACENFQKQSFRNRYELYTANGAKALVVPIIHDKSKEKNIRNIQIDNKQNWNKIHLRTLVSAYRNAPFFEYYFDYFERFFNERHTLLFDFNLSIINTCAELLKADTEISLTDSFVAEYSLDTIDVRYKLHPKKDLTVNINDEYRQVFSERHGFMPNLSIIDVVFNLGPDSREYLMGLLK